MTIEPKEILIDALNGAGTGGFEMSYAMQKRGLARFTGNQHNESWDWDRSKLEAMTFEQLQDLYFTIKSAYRR